MSLTPGTRLGRWTVDRLLARKPHGVVYRVVGSEGEVGRAEEIELPGDFSPEALREAVRGLQALQHPSLAPLLQLELSDSRAYLFWLETPGFWIETRVRWSDKPPTYQEVNQWAGQALTVAELLWDAGHPLASDSLRPEAWVLREDGVLVMVDPGLDRLVWKESIPPSLMDSFQAFGRLLESWTRASQPLATSFSWVMGRCLSDRSDQNYADFAGLRSALEERGRVLMMERQVGRTPPLQGFRIPWLNSRRQRVTPIVLTAVGLVLITILSMWSWLSRPLPPRQAPGVAVAVGSRLLVWDLETGRWTRDLPFATPVENLTGAAGRLYLTREGASQVEVLDDSTFQTKRLMTDGIANRLELSPDGQWLFVLQEERHTLLVIRCPDQASYLLPVSRYVTRALPARNSEKLSDDRSDRQLLALLSQPELGVLSLISVENNLPVGRCLLPHSGPICPAGGEGWWVAQGPNLVRLNAQLDPIQKLKPGVVCSFSSGLALLEDRVVSLEQPERHSAVLPGPPVCAARDQEGGFWIGLSEPNQLVRLSPDLNTITLQVDLPEPPVGVVWLSAKKN